MFDIQQAMETAINGNRKDAIEMARQGCRTKPNVFASRIATLVLSLTLSGEVTHANAIIILLRDNP